MEVIPLRHRLGQPYKPQPHRIPQPVYLEERKPAPKKPVNLRKIMDTTSGVLGVTLGAGLMLMGLPLTLVFGGAALLAGAHKLYAGAPEKVKDGLSVLFTGNRRHAAGDLDTPLKKMGRFAGNVALAAGGVLATMTGMAIAAFGGAHILLTGLIAGGATLAVTSGIPAITQAFTAVRDVIFHEERKERRVREGNFMAAPSPLLGLEISAGFQHAVSPAATAAKPTGLKLETLKL